MAQPNSLLRKYLSHNYLHLDYLRDFQRGAERHRDNYKTRFIRATLQLLGYICCVDVCAKSQARAIASSRHVPANTNKEATLVPEWRQLHFPRPAYSTRRVVLSQWYRRQRFTWISKLVLLLYAWCNIHILVNLYYQYAYDFDHLRLIRLRHLMRQDRLDRESFSHFSAELLHRISETRATLRFIGAPHAHMNISIECLYLFVGICTFIMFYLSHIYYKSFVSFDFHFVRELLDAEDERLHSNALAEALVVRFVESNREFSKILVRYYDNQLEFGWHQWETLKQRQLFAFHANRPPGKPESSLLVEEQLKRQGARRSNQMLELAQSECRVYATLTHMLASGALRPFNKSPAWTWRRENLIYAYHVINFTYMAIFFFILIKFSFQQRHANTRLSWNDIAIMASSVGLMVLMLSSINLYSVYFVAGSIDQVVTVNKVHHLILACIQTNSLEFLKLAKEPLITGTGGLPPTRNGDLLLQVDKMNTNYLFVIMQFKIFVAQFDATKRTVQSVILFVTAIVLLIPIIIKLHLPYLNMLNFTSIKWFAIGLSSMSLVPANLAVIPVCHLHARCVALYRAMFSLIAHVIEIESQPAGRGIYDQHAVSLLYKELRHTDKFMARFKTRFFGLTSTYTSLVKTNFWWGILALAILADNQEPGSSGQEVLTSLFSDPLGVFSSYNLHRKEQNN